MIWQITSGVNVAGAPERGASLKRAATPAVPPLPPPAAPVLAVLRQIPSSLRCLFNPQAAAASR